MRCRTAVSISIALRPKDPSPWSTRTCVFWFGYLGADTERRAHAQAAERAGVEPMPRHERGNGLPPVVQDLLAVDDEDRVALEELTHLLAEPEGMDWRAVRAHRLLLLGVLLCVEHAQLAYPRRVEPAIDATVCLVGELLENGASVAHDRHVDDAVERSS